MLEFEGKKVNLVFEEFEVIQETGNPVYDFLKSVEKSHPDPHTVEAAATLMVLVEPEMSP